MIYPTDLKETENAIVSTIADQSFIFDYKIGPEYTEAVVWIDKYESGKLVEERINRMTTTLRGDKGTIIIVKPRVNHTETTEKYYIGVSDKGGSTSSIIFENNLADKDYSSVVWGQLTDEKTVTNGEENVLATIAYLDNEFGFRSLPNKFYNNPIAHMNKLTEYNVAYLFKVKFKK